MKGFLMILGGNKLIGSLNIRNDIWGRSLITLQIHDDT